MQRKAAQEGNAAKRQHAENARTWVAAPRKQLNVNRWLNKGHIGQPARFTHILRDNLGQPLRYLNLKGQEAFEFIQENNDFDEVAETLRYFVDFEADAQLSNDQTEVIQQTMQLVLQRLTDLSNLTCGPCVMRRNGNQFIYRQFFHRLRINSSEEQLVEKLGAVVAELLRTFHLRHLPLPRSATGHWTVQNFVAEMVYGEDKIPSIAVEPRSAPLNCQPLPLCELDFDIGETEPFLREGEPACPLPDRFDYYVRCEPASALAGHNGSPHTLWLLAFYAAAKKTFGRDCPVTLLWTGSVWLALARHRVDSKKAIRATNAIRRLLPGVLETEYQQRLYVGDAHAVFFPEQGDERNLSRRLTSVRSLQDIEGQVGSYLLVSQ